MEPLYERPLSSFSSYKHVRRRLAVCLMFAPEIPTTPVHAPLCKLVQTRGARINGADDSQTTTSNPGLRRANATFSTTAKLLFFHQGSEVERLRFIIWCRSFPLFLRMHTQNILRSPWWQHTQRTVTHTFQVACKPVRRCKPRHGNKQQEDSAHQCRTFRFF